MPRSWFTLIFAVMVLNLVLDNAARAGSAAPVGVWGGSMERWLQNCGRNG